MSLRFTCIYLPPQQSDTMIHTATRGRERDGNKWREGRQEGVGGSRVDGEGDKWRKGGKEERAKASCSECDK